MEKNVKWKLITCIAVSILSIWLLLPTIWSLEHPDQADKAPAALPKTAMKLGLDLRGGIHMVMGVDLDKVVVDQLATYGRSLEKALAKNNLKATTSANPKDFELEIKVENLGDRDRIADLIAKDFSVLQFVGQTDKVMVTRLTRDQEDYVRTHALDQSIETIRNRIDEFGVAEPVISRKGDNQILVQFPGEQEPERLKGLIGQTAKLNFQMVHECTKNDPSCLPKQQADLAAKIKDVETKGGYTREKFKRLSEYRARINQDLKAQLPADTEISFEKERDVNVVNSTVLRPFLLSTKNLLGGEYIEGANVQLDRSSRQMGPEMPVVAFQMNPVGTPLFSALTTEFQGHYMAIVLDGIVRSAPVINTPITGGSGVITVGNGSIDDANREARDLSIVLRAGALPATIETQEERVIGPSIGEDAIKAGKNALLVTSALIFVFMWSYYGVAGLLANCVTLINVAMIFGILGAVGATLTLPGIAGIVLTIAMAVDAIIIIYERMREELRMGRNNRQIVQLGFDHAFATILDSNVTTAIGAFVLLQYGTGTIRGFALTLLVGITTNVIVSTFFTKTFFEAFMMGSPLTLGLSQQDIKTASAEA